MFIDKGVNQICKINYYYLLSNDSCIGCVASSKPDNATYESPVDITVVTRDSLVYKLINA